MNSKLSLTLILFFTIFSTCSLAQDNLYHVSTIRAKPGSLLQLISLIKEDISDYKSYGIDKPFLMRHSQGDHWDLLLIYPISSLDDHFKDKGIAKRQASNSLDQPYESRYYDLISFQEEQIVKGPSKKVFTKRFEKYDYYHVEIFQALAGKRMELLKERQMENVYLNELKRDNNLIFTKVMGGEAAIFTIGFYRDLKHFAESTDIPLEKENEAAKVAGFESVYTIGSYLRSLLLKHNDTLANAVR